MCSYICIHFVFVLQNMSSCWYLQFQLDISGFTRVSFPFPMNSFNLASTFLNISTYLIYPMYSEKLPSPNIFLTQHSCANASLTLPRSWHAKPGSPTQRRPPHLLELWHPAESGRHPLHLLGLQQAVPDHTLDLGGHIFHTAGDLTPCAWSVPPLLGMGTLLTPQSSITHSAHCCFPPPECGCLPH